MTFPADRRLSTRGGPVDVRVWITGERYAAETVDGSLSSFGDTEDEALSWLALALDKGGDSRPVTSPRP